MLFFCDKTLPGTSYDSREEVGKRFRERAKPLVEQTRDLWQRIQRIEDPVTRTLKELAYMQLFRPMWLESINEQYYIDYPHRRPDPEAENRKVQEKLAQKPQVLLQAAYDMVRKERGPLVLPGDEISLKEAKNRSKIADMISPHLIVSPTILSNKNKVLDYFGSHDIITVGTTPSGFERIQNHHTVNDDIGTVGKPTCNPRYSSQVWGYINNCQRCIQAYEFRRRGYDVIATKRPKNNNSILWGSECFQDANGNQVHFVYNKTSAQLQQELSSAPDGARYGIYIKWKGTTHQAHVFIAEKEGTRIRYVDPQNGNCDASSYLSYGVEGEFGFFRMDDKELTTDSRLISATLKKR